MLECFRVKATFKVLLAKVGKNSILIRREKKIQPHNII